MNLDDNNMNRLFVYEGDNINGIPHGSGTLKTELFTFKGFWEKGLRINSGTFINSEYTITVKFKQGKIYKLIESSLVPKSGFFDVLPQINYKKEGEFYREIPSIENCFLFFIDNFYLFDKLFTPVDKILILKLGEHTLYCTQDKNFQVKEIRNKNFRLISRFMGMVPHGHAKLYFKESIYIKGFLSNNYFIGPCKIIQGSLRMNFNGSYSHFPEKFEIKSDELDFETQGNSMDMNYYFNLNEKCQLFRSIIKSFIEEVFSNYRMFTTSMHIMSIYNYIIHDCILPKKNWNELENKIKRLKSDTWSNELKGSSSKQSLNTNEKVNQVISRIRYDDGSLYYGQVSQGKKNGLGCLTFPDSSKFQGYFKNDKISGLGNFYGLHYKFRGIWKENHLEKVINYYEIVN